MIKFKHKKLGTILNECANGKSYYSDSFAGYFIPKELVENSADWEEVVEKEYEILSVIDTENRVWSKSKEGDSIFERSPLCVTLDSFGDNWRIHSVKRLSDGEVFTIGDLVKFPFGNYPAKINKIIVVKDEQNDVVCKISEGSLNKIAFCVDRNVGNLLLENAEKSKQPLFVTEDGVELFENDRTFGITDWEVVVDVLHNKNEAEMLKKGNSLIFSSYDKASEYILENKPCLSVKDVTSINLYMPLYVDKIREIAKSKIQ